MACYYYVRSRNRVPYTSHIGVDCPENRPKSWTDNGLGSVPSVNLVRALSKTAIFDDALRVFSYGRITSRSRGGMVQELIPDGHFQLTMA